MTFGAYTLSATRGFMPSELAEVIAGIAPSLEIRFIGGLSRTTAGFVDAARTPSWVHLTFWDPEGTGLVLTFERDLPSPEGPYTLKIETEIATERFANDAARRKVTGDLAKRIIDRACEGLEMRVTAFDTDAP